MSLIRIFVSDQKSVVSGELHGSDGDRLVASLTAEPETVEELESAYKRFERERSDKNVFSWFHRSILTNPPEFRDAMDLEPFDAGIIVIDLAGRTVGYESTYSYPSKEGTVGVRDRLSDDPLMPEFALPYELSDDWKVVSGMPEFKGIVSQRREKRIKKKPLDARAVLYGKPMLEFIAEEMGKSEIPENEKLRAHLHSLWLLAEREDLDGRSPRDLLVAKHDYISSDLHSRSLQWSFTKDIPPDIPTDSAAYRFAGFGTHEIVVYYDLMRYLLDIYHIRLRENGRESSENGIEFLSKSMDEWLNAPNAEYSGRIPSLLIDYERKRRNITMSAHECIIDEDCPICVEMSQIFDTPMFWHLDGSHMDRDFAFSFYKTYEEWEEEERAFEEYMKREITKPFVEDCEDVEAFIREMKL